MTFSAPELLLDPSLKIWVLLPISIVMVMVGILRTYITMLLQPSKKIQSYKLIREQQHLAKVRNFKKNHFVLSHKLEYVNKLRYFTTEYTTTTKYFKDQPKIAGKNGIEEPAPVANPLTDPNSSDFLMQMVKGNAANYIPQTVIMWWVNFFFKGYIVMQLPFNLTYNFKSMLQNSINTADLDVSYVSSISWYFVNLMGLSSIYSLILNDGDVVNQMMMAQQQGQQPVMPPQLAGAGPSIDKIFKGELEAGLIVQFSSCLDGIEDRFLRKWDA